MKKSTKGALAAAAAGSLLLGGTGSLAYWTATGSLTGGTISSGTLSLASFSCSGTGLHDWQYDKTTPVAISDVTAARIVPGDTISRVCSSTLTITGDNLGATLTLAGGGLSGGTGLAGKVTPTAAWTVDGAAYSGGALTAGTHDVKASISIAFPYGTSADNTSKGLTMDLADFTVLATQTTNP